MSNTEESTDVLNPKNRGGKIRRKILEIIANNPRIIIKDTADSLKESEIVAPPGENRTGDHVDKLVDEGLVNKHIEGNKRPLTLTEEGEEKCREIGIRLPADFVGEFIEKLNDLLAPGNLDFEKREKIENNWPEGFLRTVYRINRTYPLTGLDQSRGVLSEVLRATWIFEEQKLDASTSGIVETVDSKPEPEKLEGERYKALTVALENEHFSYLESLCNLLEELTPASPQLAEIRDAVKSSYREQETKESFPKRKEVPPKVEFEIRKKHSKKLSESFRI